MTTEVQERDGSEELRMLAAVFLLKQDNSHLFTGEIDEDYVSKLKARKVTLFDIIKVANKKLYHKNAMMSFMAKKEELYKLIEEFLDSNKEGK